MLKMFVEIRLEWSEVFLEFDTQQQKRQRESPRWIPRERIQSIVLYYM